MSRCVGGGDLPGSGCANRSSVQGWWWTLRITQPTSQGWHKALAAVSTGLTAPLCDVVPDCTYFQFLRSIQITVGFDGLGAGDNLIQLRSAIRIQHRPD
jgi:hypothetical protein